MEDCDTNVNPANTGFLLTKKPARVNASLLLLKHLDGISFDRSQTNMRSVWEVPIPV